MRFFLDIFCPLIKKEINYLTLMELIHLDTTWTQIQNNYFKEVRTIMSILITSLETAVSILTYILCLFYYKNKAVLQIRSIFFGSGSVNPVFKIRIQILLRYVFDV